MDSNAVLNELRETGLSDEEIVDRAVLLMVREQASRAIPLLFKKAVDENKQDGSKVAHYIYSNIPKSKVLKLLNRELEKRHLEVLESGTASF